MSARNVQTFTPSGVTYGGVTLGFIVSEAYQVPPGLIQGPGSLTREALWKPLREAYNIAAKADHAVTREEVREMLRTLLEERFKLVVHRKSKSGAVYRLVVGKDGPRLEEAEDDGAGFRFSGGPGGYTFRNSEMMRLSGFLSGQVDRTVVDQTGLKGRYNFTLEMPEDLRGAAKSDGRSPETPTGSRLAESLKKLGLTLVAGTAAVEYLVVDRVEKPTEN